jgi:hypothetical protein
MIAAQTGRSMRSIVNDRRRFRLPYVIAMLCRAAALNLPENRQMPDSAQ